MRTSNRQMANLNWHDEPELLNPEDYELFQKTLGEWKKFASGDMSIDGSIVPGEVLDSWIRCKKLGVDPRGNAIREELSGDKLNELLEDNQSFIEISRPFMKNLYRFVSGSGFVVILCDKSGYLLEIIGDKDVVQFIRKGHWVVGALCDEASAGNNGVGTLVELKRPVSIIGCHHFRRFYHNEAACSAPIFDPDGEFIGGISVTGRHYKVNLHTLGMAVAAAQAVENELKTHLALAEAQIANIYKEKVIASIPEGLMTTDNLGRITLINVHARRIFSLNYEHVEGRHIRKVLGAKNHHISSLLEDNEELTDMEVRIFSGDSSSDYTLSCNPILSQTLKHLGKIIILMEIKRVKTLVNKMIGAKANFRFEDIYGQNRKFLETIEQARIVAHSRSNVLLLGKSGTGKDLFAQAIHNDSERRNGPYVAITCAAIPRDLVTSELFGYSEGAFTGSRRGGNQGKFEMADGGTIFLDEIAETPLELQAVLLRVIEDKSIIRIGGSRVQPVDVRIIAATNKDLQAEVQKGNFREDLYYRLNVFAIHMVPLSERPDDIALLANAFIKKYAKALGKGINRLDDRVIEAFVQYSWPGNVRELQNVIERMVNFCQTGELTADLIPRDIMGNGQPALGPEEFRSPKHFEREMIARMLEANLTKSDIAQKMEMTRTTLYRKLKQYKLA